MNRDVTRVLEQIKSCLRYISYCMKRERERERDRQTDRQTERQADRQTGRQTDRQTDRACISESVPGRKGNLGEGGGGGLIYQANDRRRNEYNEDDISRRRTEKWRRGNQTAKVNDN